MDEKIEHPGDAYFKDQVIKSKRGDHEFKIQRPTNPEEIREMCDMCS